MTHLEMARRRMHNLRVTDAMDGTPGAVVAWLGALQAQDYPGATWALGLRLQGATADTIERAFTEGALLRTHLLRPTWHFVAPADIRWLLLLTGPRVNALNATYYRKVELDARTLTRTADVLERALQGGHQLTRTELRSAMENAGITTAGDLRMGYILMHAELAGVICSGPRRGKQFTYALLEERAPAVPALDREEALSRLAGCYFRSRGPATVHDFAKWSGLTIAEARRGLESVQPQFLSEKTESGEFWFADGKLADASASVAHLLSIYDEYVSSYKDRSAMGGAEYGALLQAMGNALLYIIVVDGQLVGTWKRTVDKTGITVATNLFKRLNRAQTRALKDAAERYQAFVQQPVVLA